MRMSKVIRRVEPQGGAAFKGLVLIMDPAPLKSIRARSFAIAVMRNLLATGPATALKFGSIPITYDLDIRIAVGLPCLIQVLNPSNEKLNKITPHP